MDIDATKEKHMSLLVSSEPGFIKVLPSLSLSWPSGSLLLIVRKREGGALGEKKSGGSRCSCKLSAQMKETTNLARAFKS